MSKKSEHRQTADENGLTPASDKPADEGHAESAMAVLRTLADSRGAKPPPIPFLKLPRSPMETPLYVAPQHIVSFCGGEEPGTTQLILVGGVYPQQRVFLPVEDFLALLEAHYANA